MKNDEKICGTCRWAAKDPHDPGEGWVCTNDASDNCADFVGYKDECEEWEART